MKILLVNPPGPFCRAGSRWPHRRKARAVGIDYHPFPFGLAYAASRLLADGHEARLVDCIAQDLGEEALAARVEAFGPEVIFMETSAPSFHADVEVVRRLGLPCIAGGAHATATAREHLEAGFRAVIVGEYDQVISEAVGLEPRPWLATTEQPEAAHAPLCWDLDAVPYPPWDQMSVEKYNDPFCKGRSVAVLSTRGCPHRCGFCTIAPYAGQVNHRRRDPEAVCDEIAVLIERYRPDEIYFDDDTINANRKHMLGLCEALVRRDFGIPFSCMGNAEEDREVLEAMARAGCRAFKFGVETGDPEVMRRIPKDLDLEAVRRTVEDCRRLGIQTHATFLLGLPGENKERAQRTVEFALGLRSHTLQFAIATPYPGTAFYEEAKREGWLVGESWQQFDPAAAAVVSYPGYSAEDIAAMHDWAWKRWQRHMLLHQPATVAHHFANAFRREGLPGVARLARYAAGRAAAIWGLRP